jgi:hypothetical protein
MPTAVLKALTCQDTDDHSSNDLVMLKYNGVDVWGAPHTMNAGNSVPINRSFPLNGQAQVTLVEFDTLPFDPNDDLGTGTISASDAGKGDLTSPSPVRPQRAAGSTRCTTRCSRDDGNGRVVRQQPASDTSHASRALPT